MDYFAKIKELNIKPFDTSHNEQKYIVSYKNNHFEANEKLYELLCTLQCSESLAEACLKYSEIKQKEYSESAMLELLDNKISILFKETDDKNKAFIFNRKILDANKTNNLAGMFVFLHKNYLQVVIGLLYIVLTSIFVSSFMTQGMFSLNNLDLYTFIFIILFLFLSTFFHELGHASACKYYGLNTGNIGFGAYINILVFYVDISNIWLLDRKKRIKVNLGGVYFQTIILIICYLLYFFTYNKQLAYIIVCTNINFLFVLNPFLKFDGYWITSDILGVANLRQRGLEIIKYTFNKIFSSTKIDKPQLLTMKPIIKYSSLIYSVLSGIFLLFFFVYFIPRVIYGFIVDLPQIYRKFEVAMANNIVPFDFMIYLLPKTILVLLYIYIISKMLYKLIKMMTSNVKYSKSA